MGMRASLVRITSMRTNIIESRAGEKGWGWWELTENQGRQTKVGKEFNSEIIRILEYNAWECGKRNSPKIDAKDTLAISKFSRRRKSNWRMNCSIVTPRRSLTPTAFEHFCKALNMPKWDLGSK